MSFRTLMVAGMACLVGVPLSAQNDRAKKVFEQRDADKDGYLTPDEAKEIPDLFNRLVKLGDSDEDGKLSFEEFSNGLKSLQSPQPSDAKQPDEPTRRRFAPDPAALFNRLDENSDGKLDKEELSTEWRGRFEPLFEKAGKESLTQEEFTAAMQQSRRPGDNGGQRPGRFPGASDGQPRGPVFLSKLDKDNNGKLSPTELAFAVTLLEELDRNQDGELDAGELMGFRPGPGGPGMRRPGERSETDSARPDRPRRPAGAGTPNRPEQPADDDFAKRLFEHFDTDSDGFITKSEAPERLAENFGNLDRNNDDKLSVEEIQSRVSPSGRRPND